MESFNLSLQNKTNSLPSSAVKTLRCWDDLFKLKWQRQWILCPAIINEFWWHKRISGEMFRKIGQMVYLWRFQNIICEWIPMKREKTKTRNNQNNNVGYCKCACRIVYIKSINLYAVIRNIGEGTLVKWFQCAMIWKITLHKTHDKIIPNIILIVINSVRGICFEEDRLFDCVL